MNQLDLNIKPKVGHTFIYEICDEKGTPIYIGKTIGILKDRFKDHSKQKELHPCCSILNLDMVPTSEWRFWESHYIFLYKTWGFTLINKNNGGGGPTNFIKTEEAKQKVRKPKPRGFGEKVKQLLSKSILQLDSITEGLIKEWPSSKEVDKIFHCDSGACARGEQRIAGGFKWKFKDPILVSKQKYSREILAYNQPILQFDLQDNFIKEWPSVKETLKFFKSDVYGCLKGHQNTAGGFKWKYKFNNNN